MSSWALFLGLIGLGLRPVLTTVIVADDFIGPFSMFVNAGPGLTPNLRAGYEAASYGHFNYLGQLVGALTNWTWMQIMGVGVRYSTIYAVTKFVVFAAVIVLGARVMRRILWSDGGGHSVWRVRIVLALVLIGTLQIHVVWSNDPVASYPMSGYASLLIGLVVLDRYVSYLKKPSWRSGSLVSILILASCLYYEVNVALLPALVILTLFLWFRCEIGGSRQIRQFLHVIPTLVAPTALILFLQVSNSAKSAQYAGTAVSLGDSTLPTFLRLLVSNLPFSSWHLALSWLEDNVNVGFGVVLATSLIAAIALLFLNGRGERRVNLAPAVITSGTFITYGASATLIQASTEKVQNEATRIGSVYNFYAMGSIAVAVSISILILFLFERWRSMRLLLPALIGLGVFQFLLNTAIQERHFNVLPQNRNLLVAFTEHEWTQERRCEVMSQWLTMPWPTYYENSMVTGIERAYVHFNNDVFCGRL